MTNVTGAGAGLHICPNHGAEKSASTRGWCLTTLTDFPHCRYIIITG